ncbi:M48 family metalloprotease [Ectothiorhodospiraceae bacterium WFHF3C12]|nr:M48 family metalloprotease [Ectothiorhodospiraceae bacterium WFHF3C12]
MERVECPHCGAANRGGSTTCRMCGDLLAAGRRTSRRVQRKILRRTDFIAASRANQRATRWLLLVLAAIAVLLGYLVGWSVELSFRGPPPEAPAVWFLSRWGVLGGLGLLLLSLGWSALALSTGDRLVLRISGARPVTREQAPQLHNVVEEMAIAAGLARPAVYVIETPALNAFATGLSRRRAAIVVTRGLLETLSREELQGVVGHEMGHIVNLDMRYATAVGVTVGLVALVADLVARLAIFGGGRRSRGAGVWVGVIMLVFAVLAPVFARLVQMAVSRQREFLADATSVRLTRNPQGLIGALEKLGASQTPLDGVNRATQHLYIVNPLRNFTERASRLWATHPPIERRIHRLRNLGN